MIEAERFQPYVGVSGVAHYEQHGVAVAGGFEAANIERLFGPLAAEYPDLSCDAEGRLRSGEVGKTVLDMEKVRKYIRAWKNVALRSDTTERV